MSVDMKEIASAVEGILFAAGEPVDIKRICLALELDRETAETVLRQLGDGYAFERRGIRLLRMEDSYQLCSAPEYADVIRKAFEVRKPAKLSQPALEALTGERVSLELSLFQEEEQLFCLLTEGQPETEMEIE